MLKERQGAGCKRMGPCSVLLLLLFILPCATSVLAQDRAPATLRVSPDGGTLGECAQDRPCRDILQAIRFARPGDTVLIEEGDYPGFRLQDVRATQDKPLVIKGVGKVRIFPNQELRDVRDNIQISQCDWITIDNIQVFNAARAGIRIDQSHHITIKNSVFGTNGTWGVFANHSNDLVLEDNEVFGSREQHGIYYSNSADRPVIRRNRVYGNAMCGIHLNGDLSTDEGRDVVGDGIISGAVIEDNEISDNGRRGGAAINADGLHDAVIRGNKLTNNHAAGIALYKADGASGPARVKVYDNTIAMAPGARAPIIVRNKSGPVEIRGNKILRY